MFKNFTVKQWYDLLDKTNKDCKANGEGVVPLTNNKESIEYYEYYIDVILDNAGEKLPDRKIKQLARAVCTFKPNTR